MPFPPHSIGLKSGSGSRPNPDNDATLILPALKDLESTKSAPHQAYTVRLRKLSVILPFYNEADHAEKTADEVASYARQNPQHQFLLVDDGSTDETLRILCERIESTGLESIQVVANGRNMGKGRTIKSALSNCTGEGVCFLDGDLAYSLDHVESINQALENHDVVIGSRVLANHRGGGTLRQLYSATFNFLVRSSLGLPFKDTQAGLKGFRRPVAERLFRLQRTDGFGFDVELLYLARKFGYSVAEIPARLSSVHSYKGSAKRLIIQGGRAARDVLSIRANERRGLYSL